MAGSQNQHGTNSESKRAYPIARACPRQNHCHLARSYGNPGAPDYLNEAGVVRLPKMTAMARPECLPSPSSPDHEVGDQELASRCAELMFAADHASQQLGIKVESVSPGCARLTMEVTEGMINGHDICHGGYIFSLADSAFAFACNTYGEVTVAAGAQIDFIMPARCGDRLAASAVERTRRGRTGIYDVTVVRLPDLEVVAEFRGRSRTLSVAIREGRPVPVPWASTGGPDA